MRPRLGIGAIVLGLVGVALCPVAIGLGWWAAVRTIDRATVIAARLDKGLSEADARLERVQRRVAAVRAELSETHAEAEKLAENSELAQVRAAIDRLVERLLPTVERAAELADSLRMVAAGLRAVEDVATDLGAQIQQPSRASAAADAIDRAADALDVPQERINTVKSKAALRLKRELLELSLAAAAGSERLAEGLADARQEVAGAREQVGEYRNTIVFWVRIAAAAHIFVWLWIGLGQLCLIDWGRRQFAKRDKKSADGGLVQPV